jgi:hypothetical protein
MLRTMPDLKGPLASTKIETSETATNAATNQNPNAQALSKKGEKA